MPASIKAGLIGAAVITVLSLLGLIPCVGCITFILRWLVFAGTGVLAAYWLTPPRTVGEGAKVGAIAALISAAVGGVVNAAISGVSFLIAGGAQAFSSQAGQLPPELVDQLGEIGIDLAGIGATIGGVLAVSAVCCVAGALLAAALGALGGLSFAAAKSD